MSDSTTRRIPLTQGRFALVDAADFEMLSHWKWYYCSTGYAKSYNGGGRYRGKPFARMHRVIMLPDPGQDVDHINGDTLDNRRANLRVCTHQENTRNQGPRGGTSRFKNVCWDKAQSAWRVHTIVNYTSVQIGMFGDEIEAAKAYDAFAVAHLGEFARLNFPELTPSHT